jgi:hypothetical protein
MDTIATFSNRSNARRAAEAMIRRGTAPAVDYGIKPLDKGRFEIAWKAAAEPTEPATAAAAAEPAPEFQPAAAGRAPQKSRYAIDPAVIAAGRLPEKAPVVTSAANQHYQKKFDALFALATAGDWDAVRDYVIRGSNSYSKMVVRYREDLLAVHAASRATAECAS